ncbi:MAG TPA: hypothetical protein VNZ58_10590 [Thermomicrobiales bacterium]|nr:hypothetical protein [Thermomicrobiales bacterium]
MIDSVKSIETRNKSALLAGLGLLVMAILGGYANFGALESDNTSLAAWLFSLVVVLDIIVAIALYTYLESVDRHLSRATATMRVGSPF